MTHQKTVLIINPRKSKMKEVKQKIKKGISINKLISSIIRHLNIILTTRCEYFRLSYHSLPTFWSAIMSKRHRIRNAHWIRNMGYLSS